MKHKLFEMQITSSNAVHITLLEGAEYTARIEYCSNVDIVALCNKVLQRQEVFFSNEQLLDLEYSTLCYEAELYARSLLDRAEQCRAGLYQKLYKKQYKIEYINKALDYLEASKILDDFRFCKAWLSCYCINHAQGKTRLLAELLKRGINRLIATQAVSDYFSLTPEKTVCQKALQKALRTHKNQEYILSNLHRNGFSNKLIYSVMSQSND